MGDGEGRQDDARVRSERALKSFIDSQSKVSDATAKLAQRLPDLAARIGDGKEGLIAAIADLIDAIDAHREEMTLVRAAIMKAGGINVDLGGMFGRGRRPT